MGIFPSFCGSVYPGAFAAVASGSRVSAGGIRDQAGTEYGLQPPESIILLSECEWDFVENYDADPDTICLFFSFGNGDYVGWDRAQDGILIDHERSAMERCDLNEFLDTHFAELCEGNFEFPL